LACYDRYLNPVPLQESIAAPVERSFFDRWFRVPMHARNS
jgi:hypothetical protein